jgi:uncharacterized protein (TIGR04222 family)
MSEALTMGNTWGLTGPMFLVLYGVLFVITAAVILLVRKWIWNASGPISPVEQPGELAPSDLALLAEPEVTPPSNLVSPPQWHPAALVALITLERRCVIAVESPFTAALNRQPYNPDDRSRRKWWAEQTVQASTVTTVRRLGPLPPDSPAVETSVYGAVAVSESVPVAEVSRRVWSGSALVEARQGLVVRGLLPSGETIRWLRTAAVMWLPLVALGATRLLVGMARQRPVQLLVVCLAVTGYAAFMSVKKPKRTPKGDKLLKTARTQHLPLQTGAQARLAHAPSGLVETSALASLALFGPVLLWKAQPGLAASLAAPATHGGGSAGGWFSGSGCGGGGCGGDGCGG